MGTSLAVSKDTALDELHLLGVKPPFYSIALIQFSANSVLHPVLYQPENQPAW